MRFQTFNASLNRSTAGELVADLSTPDDPQAATVAEIIQRTRPDVLLLNEFDFVPSGEAVDLFRENYLEVGHNGARPIHYRYAFIAPSNTGIPSGFDLDNNGTIGGRQRRVRLRRVPRPLRHGRAEQVPDRPRGCADLPEVPLGRHAGRDAARRPGHRRTRRLVLTRGARGRAAVEQVALGPADPGRAQDRPLPGLPPDPAGLRRPRGPQRHPQLRRDPVLGRLRAAAAPYMYDDQGRHGGLHKVRGS